MRDKRFVDFKEPECGTGGTIQSEPSGFIHATHYHCKKCSGDMQYLARIHWRVEGGVRAIGVCKPCGLIMVERENTNFMFLWLFPFARMVKWFKT